MLKVRKNGLKKRPWPYTLLVILFLLEPVFKIIHLKLITGSTFSVIFRTIAEGNRGLESFLYFFLFPIAGLLLIKVRRISYYLVLGILAFCFYQLISFKPYSWPYFTATPSIILILIGSISVLCLIFFLIPSVRNPFFDASVRWWESKDRYMVDFPCQIEFINNKRDLGDNAFKLLNISQSGAFLKSEVIKNGDYIKIKFLFLGKKYSYAGDVVSVHGFNDSKGVGVKFVGGPFARIQRFLFMKRLKKAGYRVVEGRS